MEFIPFEPGHLKALMLQPAQGYLQPLLDNEEYGEVLKEGGYSWSGRIEGKIVGACGVLPQWPGRGVGWALMGRIPPREWLRVTRRTIVELERAHADGIRRIETAVRAGFKPGYRWVKALGFTVEGLMEAYGPDGTDYLLYARVRHICPPEIRRSEGG